MPNLNGVAHSGFCLMIQYMFITGRHTGNMNDNLPPGCTDKDIEDAQGASMDVCPTCDGEGCIFESNCCEASFAEPGWPDNDVCSKCHEHAEPIECERCDATGQIDIAKEKAERRLVAEEDKADEKRDNPNL